MISNAVDATSNLKLLALKGEVKGDIGDTKIEVKSIKMQNVSTSDQGIGMTEEEVKRYLNQVAFYLLKNFG